MDLKNLNKVIEKLKQVNEEVVESKRKSDFDLLIFNDLKTKYSIKIKELDEAKQEIDELKHYSKLLEEKLKSLEQIKIQNRRLIGKVSRLKGKLDTMHKDNRFYLNELNEVKALLNNSSLKNNNPVDKVFELQKVLREKEEEYQENLDKIRNETKKSLLTLESKIVSKLKTETCNKNNKDNKSIDGAKKTLNSEQIIKVLNVSNLRLREKLMLKDIQYRELEDNYLRLKVESLKKIKKIKNHMFGDIKSESSWKSIKNKNIDMVLKEFDDIHDDYLNNKSVENSFFDTFNDDSSESESTQEILELKGIGFGDNNNNGQTFKLDFKQNEISVEVQSCSESN